MSASIDLLSNFQPNQIVCLEFGGRCLYAEIIQVVSVRGLCWARPLMLVEFTSLGDSVADRKHILWDLRGGSDLLWPLSLFRVVIDTEAIAFLTELQLLESEEKDAVIAHRQLRDFVGKVWEALPSAFL
ncbi:MAG TPA: hypothetical protein VK211_18005 [Kamptonema sp.]|nr:hypothetical protein [Kamptonema sp.]